MSDYNSEKAECAEPTPGPMPKVRMISYLDLEGPVEELKEVVALADTIEEGMNHGAYEVDRIHAYALRCLVDVLRLRVEALERLVMGDEAEPI